MRRYRVGTAGRGRGRPYKKRFSQIKIVLTDEADKQPGANKRMKANLKKTQLSLSKQPKVMPEEVKVSEKVENKKGESAS